MNDVELQTRQEATHDDLRAALGSWTRERGCERYPLVSYLWMRCAEATDLPCIELPLERIAAALTPLERTRTLSWVERVEQACMTPDAEV